MLPTRIDGLIMCPVRCKVWRTSWQTLSAEHTLTSTLLHTYQHMPTGHTLGARGSLDSSGRAGHIISLSIRF